MGQASREETAREPAQKHLTIGQLSAPLFKSLNLIDKKIVPRPSFSSSEFQGPGSLSSAADLLSNGLLAEDAKQRRKFTAESSELLSLYCSFHGDGPC
jgi:hypothetical protein